MFIDSKFTIITTNSNSKTHSNSRWSIIKQFSIHPANMPMKPMSPRAPLLCTRAGVYRGIYFIFLLLLGVLNESEKTVRLII